MSGEIKVQSRTVEEKGIVLPWVRYEPTGPIRLPNGEMAMTERLPKGSRIEHGEVFIPMSTIYELAEQDIWDSQFGSAFLLDQHEGYALEQAGLAARETRGGFHRTDKLLAWLEEEGLR
jgi:hypothetical protein